MAFILGALVFEHRLCRTGDLTRINVAFFNMNALVGLCLVLGVAGSLIWADWTVIFGGHMLLFPGSQQ